MFMRGVGKGYIQDCKEKCEQKLIENYKNGCEERRVQDTT